MQDIVLHFSGLLHGLGFTHLQMFYLIMLNHLGELCSQSNK